MTDDADDPRYTQEELNAKVNAILRALMATDEGRIDGEGALDALAFVAAVIFDMHPNLIVPSQLRKAAESHGAVVWTYLRWMRKHYEEKGVKFGELIGGEPHLTGDLPAGHTRH